MSAFARYFAALLGAMLLHALLAVSLFGFNHSSKTAPPIGQPLAVKVFLYQDSERSQASPKVLAKQDVTRAKSPIAAYSLSPMRQHRVKQERTSVHAMTPHAFASLRHTGLGEDQTLLALLHKAIANQQQYPDSAQALGEAGVVQVQFNLAASGEISAQVIISSSGYADLDQAALSAVRAINPFIPAKRYLHATEIFKVAVQFQSSG